VEKNNFPKCFIFKQHIDKENPDAILLYGRSFENDTFEISVELGNSEGMTNNKFGLQQ
jgi:hypothetical protein